jgi:1-deoxyxylulose-5-phosphate synthase
LWRDELKYRYLGNSGLAVSSVCLGTATFGQNEWGCDRKVSGDILNSFAENGGNFIDTADKYGNKNSERIIGDWLNTRNRDNFVIATKCFFKTQDDINCRGLSSKHIINACEASLSRLQTDYIDLYQIHNFDPQTPFEETLEALDFLVQQGKVRYIGLSNLPAWRVMKADCISKLKGYKQFISGQYLYNLLKRDIEIEVLPACKDVGIGIICWSPLSGGMLTGKYIKPDKPPLGTRLASRTNVAGDRYHSWYKKSLAVVNKVNDIASKYNKTPAIISISWLQKNDHVASVSVGAKKVEQIIENCKASEWELPIEDWNALNRISCINYGYPRELSDKNSDGWFDNIQ